MATLPYNPFPGNTVESQVQQPTQQLAESVKGTEETVIPPGYKHTEVGVIPEDWDYSRLGDLTTRVGSGITPTGGERVYVTAGHPFLRSQNVGWGILDLHDLAFITDEMHASFAASEIKEGDVLLNITGASIGRSAVANTAVARGNVNQHVCEIRPDPEQIDSQFLNSYLLSDSGQKQIDSFQAGGNRQGLNYSQIRSFLVPRPSLCEQRAIAEALSDVDQLLGALEKLIAKKRAIKQAAMQQLLTGKTRLPGFSGEWETIRLLALADYRKALFDDGDWIEAEFLTENGIRLVQTGNIGEGRFIDRDSKKYISPESFEKLRCKPLKVGDILICRLAEPAGRACILPDIGEERMITAVDVTIFRPPQSTADRRFLVNIFNTSGWFEAVTERCGGSTRTRIARAELGKIEVKLPPLPEQMAIADILSDMQAEVTTLERNRDKIHTIKQGMMQQLLTGRVRLVSAR